MKVRCQTPFCRNKKVEGRNFCSKCRTRKYRERNPLKSCYDSLKHNAKRRNIEFSLTLKEFKEFCIKTNYLLGKGKTRESYSIDRIDNTKGYCIDNIQVLSLSLNSKKRNRTLQYMYGENGMEFWVTKDKPFNRGDDFDSITEDVNDNPFM